MFAGSNSRAGGSSGNTKRGHEEGYPKAGTEPNARGGHNIIGKLRRWNITNNSEDCEPDQDNAGSISKITSRSKNTETALIAALKGNYLFSELTEGDLEQMTGAMSRVCKQPGDIVIRQGHKGTEFFILEKGHADVFVSDQKVYEYGPGACFGELALIYNAKRAATITATSTCTLWSLDLRTFRRMLATASSSQTMARIEFLRRVPLLKNLANEQVSKLAGALTSQTYADGDTIIRQGEYGNAFFLVKDGTVKCTQCKQDREVDLLTLGTGDYFGEMALLLDEPRHANVTAVGHVEVLSLEKEDFTKLLGPVREVLSHQMRTRVLKSVPLLSRLSDSDLDLVGNAMHVQQFEPNQYIVKEGEPGSRFYIINEGVVKCCKTSVTDPSVEEEMLRLHDQEYFGERSLLKEEPRAASVVAVTSVECLVLERSDFTGLLGNLEEIMTQEVKRREDMRQVTRKTEQGHPQQHKSGRGQAGDSAAPTGAGAILPYTHLRIEDLTVLRTLGIGTFGRVKLIQYLATRAVGALKCMQKAQIIACHQERNIMNEKQILSACKHPFILELIGTLKDENQIYMLMELVQGGELWLYIYDRFDLLPRTKIGGFRREHAQFYAGCVISALEYIHRKGVAYRDLKPENLLMDVRGYLKVVDFGFAKAIPFEKNGVLQPKSFTLCGTPEYLAPELVLSRGHDKSVDYWALGCLLYELLVGHTPFQDERQDEIFRKIVHSQTHLHFPRSLDNASVDLIKALMNSNPAFRLGNLLGGPTEIMDHAFFTGLDWTQLQAKALSAPYRPNIRDPMDVSNFDPYPEDEEIIHYTGAQSIFDQF